MKTVAVGQNQHSVQPAVALLGKALRVHAIYLVLEDPRHPSAQYCVQWHHASQQVANIGVDDAAIAAGLAMVRQMIEQVSAPTVVGSGDGTTLSNVSCSESQPDTTTTNPSTANLTLSSCQLDADVFINVPTPIAIALSSPVLITATHQAQFILVRSSPDGWTEAELGQVQDLLGSAISTIEQALAPAVSDQQIQQQQLVYQLAQNISNTTEIDHIFAIALQGLGQSLSIQHASILLLKYSQPVLQQAISDFTNIRFRIAHNWSAESLHASSGYVPPVVTCTANSCNSQMFPVSKCNVIQQAIQIAPQSLAIRSRQAIPIQSAHLVRESLSPSSAPEPQSSPTAPPTQQPSAPATPINPAHDSYFQSWYQDQPNGSLLITPIENRGKILGFVVLHDCETRFWCDNECALVETVATQLSGAILQVQTLRQVQSMVEKRTAQLQRSIEVQGKLYEQTRRQIDQLRRLNQLKDDFLSTISHELLTPLTSMRLAARMLRQTDLPPERRHAYLDILEQQCSQETELINDLLALQRIESQPLQVELQEIDLNAYVQDIIRANRPLWDNKNVELRVDLPDQPLMMRTDVTSLHRVLRELLTNASKYSRRGEDIHLHIQSGIADHIPMMEMTLINRGTGIPEEELPYVFDKFRRGQAAITQAIQGTGLGLALVQCLVQQLNGKIAVESTPIQDDLWETVFTVKIPLMHQPQVNPIA